MRVTLPANATLIARAMGVAYGSMPESGIPKLLHQEAAPAGTRESAWQQQLAASWRACLGDDWALVRWSDADARHFMSRATVAHVLHPATPAALARLPCAASKAVSAPRRLR